MKLYGERNQSKFQEFLWLLLLHGFSVCMGSLLAYSQKFLPIFLSYLKVVDRFNGNFLMLSSSMKNGMFLPTFYLVAFASC